MIRFPSVLLAAVLGASAASGVEFTDHAVSEQRVPVDCALLGEYTLVKCARGLWLVDWSRPEAARDSLLVRRDLPTDGHRAPLVAWGDSVVALAAEEEGGHLVVHLDGAGRPVVDEVAAADWLPDTARLGDRPWFVDTAGRALRLLPALGAAGDTVVIGPGEGSAFPLLAFAGDRAVFTAVNPPRFRAWDLTDPAAPRAGPEVPLAAWADPQSLAVRDAVLYLGVGTLQSWDVADVDRPVMLDELGAASGNTNLTPTSDGRLATWYARSSIRLVDVSEPSSLRNLAIWTVLGAGVRPERIAVGATRAALLDRGIVRGFALPDGVGTMRADGRAWPVLDDPRWARLAVDGQRVWIQHSARMVADVGAGTVESAPGANVAGNDRSAVFLAVHRGQLLSAPGDGRLVSEDVGDPRRPRTTWEHALAAPAEDVVLHGDRWTAVSPGAVEVFDVSAPAAPRRLSRVTVPAAERTRAAVAGSLLVVVQAFANPAYPSYTYEHVLRVYRVVDGGEPVEAAAVPLLFAPMDPDDSIDHTLVEGLRVVDGAVYVYGDHHDFAWQSFAVALRLDLGDPAAPAWGPPSWADAGPSVENALMTTPTGTYLVRHADGELVVQRCDGGEPSLAPVAASVPAERPRALAVSDDGRVAILTFAGVETWFLSGVGFDPPPPVPAAPAGAVLAVPNPFNPGTRLCFDVGAAGPVRVDVYDLAGRRVRTLRAELPVGPAALPWDGRDDDGRILASGVYLVRAEAGGEAQRGRCVLVR